MKIGKSWLQELVGLKVPILEIERLLPLRTIATKEVTDRFIELDMKGYNRADLLSMRGVAYEVAAITNSQVNFTEVDDFVWTKRTLDDVKAVIEDQKLCRAYCVAKIENLKVDSSPKEWIEKLEASGIRSINNIVDLTNLLMLEYGQTMHAFDAAKVKNENMIVRNAKDGEKFVTIDGRKRVLSADDLLITDPEKILSMSGIMGGKESEVSNNTDTILLEVAIFDPVSIRRSSQRHGLYSEASKRIQHGLTSKRMLQALDAAIKMYEEMGGKLTAICLTGDLKDNHKTVKLTQQRINSLIGIDIKPERVEELLTRLQFTLKTAGKGEWEVIPPYFRLDINIEEDLIEEVARMYGYEKIPAKPLEGKLPQPIDQSLQDLIYNLKVILSKSGLTEILSYSFYSTQTLKALGWTKELADKHLVKIANPISSETEYMRMNIWPNLVEVVEKNIKQGYKQSLPSGESKDIAIFEIGKVYWIGENKKPQEDYRLALALMNNIDNPLPELFKIFQKALKSTKINIRAGNGLEERHRLFHPVRNISLLVGDQVVGGMAEVHPKVLHDYGVDQRVAIIEIDLQHLV